MLHKHGGSAGDETFGAFAARRAFDDTFLAILVLDETLALSSTGAETRYRFSGKRLESDYPLHRKILQG